VSWCLIKSEQDAFREALVSRKLDPFKLANMTSEQRRAEFEKYVDGENAVNINSLYESKLLLKNQVQGFKTWVKRALQDGNAKQYKRDILTKIERLSEDKILAPNEVELFKEDLIRTRLGLGISYEEAKTINDLSQAKTDAREKWEDEMKAHPNWQEDPKGTRDQWVNSDKRIEYGLHQVALQNYVNGLKSEAKKIPFKQYPLLATKEAIKSVPNVAKSLISSLDDSFFGRQGIKNLYGSREQKRVWVRDFAKSFRDINNELLAKKIDGFETMDLIRADIFSRPNAIDGKYKAGNFGLDIAFEEPFPTSLPERIPALGRLYKASETAFSGGALRMRADLADIYISMAEKNKINMLDPDNARPLGHLVGSLTGRGSLGRLTPFSRGLNLVLWSARFFAANLQTLTSPVTYTASKIGIIEKGSKGQQLARKEAAKNMLSIAAHVAGLYMIAGFLDPESVDKDPRSTNFGRIKVFDKWVDVTGGMRTIATLAARTVPTKRNGEWGFWYKSSTGNWTNLYKPEYGQADAVDVIVDTIALNRLAPIGAVIRDMYRGEMFGGDPFNIQQLIINSTIPLSIQNLYELREESWTAILALSLAELSGFGVSAYEYKSNWEQRTSKTMTEFREQVGQDKFKQANEDYNRAYNVWLEEVEKDSKYKNLTDEGRKDLKSKARSAIEDKILDEYGYKEPKKESETREEKKEKKTIKKLLP